VYGAFSSCTILRNVMIPDGVTSIGEKAFSSCWNLTNITIPNSVTSIGAYAFYGCSGLTNVTIPNSVTSIGSYAFNGCSKLKECTLPVDSKVQTLPSYVFSGCSSLEKMSLPVSVTQIGDYAFQNCTALTEMKIPSSICKVGTEAFKGCTALNDVYTYTIEPQSIAQNTFATYASATLHVPAVSYYNYYYNTQWSRFLKLVNFDEPYDYAFIEKDYEMLTDDAGILRGDPQFDIWAGGAFFLKGDKQQGSRELHMRCSGNKWSSLIPHGANFKATKLYIDIEVNKDFWYAFTFPFDVNLNDVQKEGDWVFRRYDGSMRAADGSGGWRAVEGNTLTANKGYVFRTNTAGTLSIPISTPSFNTADCNLPLDDNASSHGAQHAGWNFIGNPYTAYYSMNDMEYSAPIIIFNGTSYEAYRPGDDDVALHPFQAYFVQKPSGTSNVGFAQAKRMSQNQSEEAMSEARERRIEEAKLRKARKASINDRQLINITLSNGDASDKCRIVYNEKQKMDYEAECDAAKFLSTESVPQIYSIDDNGVKYAINERPQGDSFVQLGYVAPTAGKFTLAASRMDVPVVVHDYEEDVTFNLADGEYTFETEAGSFAQRFAISLALPEEATGIEGVEAEGAADGDDNTATYDMSGRAVNKTAKGVLIKGGKKQLVK